MVSSSGSQKLRVEVDVIPDGEAMPESADALAEDGVH
jgi:hypothetical protein